MDAGKRVVMSTTDKNGNKQLDLGIVFTCKECDSVIIFIDESAQVHDNCDMLPTLCY